MNNLTEAALNRMAKGSLEAFIFQLNDLMNSDEHLQVLSTHTNEFIIGYGACMETVRTMIAKVIVELGNEKG